MTSHQGQNARRNRSISTILGRLESVKATRKHGQWEAKCPSHDDQHRSLSIGTDADGNVLLCCHAGCSFENILSALDLPNAASSTTTPPTKQPEGKAFSTANEAIQAYKLGKPSGTWIYMREGQPACVVCRWEGRDGKKIIRPVSKIGERWYQAHLEGPRPLYQSEALPPNGPIYVVEGEKKCVANTQQGLFSVTSAGGANAAAKTDWTALQGRDIVILPDADIAGKKYAQEVADILKGVGVRTIKIVELPELEKGEDVYDWYHRLGRTSEQIKRLVAATPFVFEDTAGLSGSADKGAFENFKRWPELYRIAQGLPMDPLPIVPERPKAGEFPQISLHPVIEAIHEITRAPYVLCAQSVLAATAVATQHIADISIPGLGGPETSSQPTSCFFVSVAQSGERKTAIDRLATLGIHEYQQQLKANYKQELLDYNDALWRWQTSEKERLRNESGPPTEPPKPPKQPILQVKEPTQEGLFRILKVGQLAQGLLNDEGGTFLGGFSMSKEQRMRTVSTLNKLWDGGDLDRPRAADYEVLSGRRLSLHLQIQPKASADLLADGMLTDLGFSARCLVADPESTIGTRFLRPTPEVAHRWVRWFADRLKVSLQHKASLDEDGDLRPPTLQLEGEALRLWGAFHDEIEAMMPKHREIMGWLGKAPQHVLRLAALLTVFQDPRATHLPAAAIEEGIALVRFYLSEQLRANAARPTEQEELADLLLRWLHDKWGEQKISARDICRKGPTKLRKTAVAKHTIMLLVERGYLQPLSGSHLIQGEKRNQCFAITDGFSGGVTPVAGGVASVAEGVAKRPTEKHQEKQENSGRVASVAGVATHSGFSGMDGSYMTSLQPSVTGAATHCEPSGLEAAMGGVAAPVATVANSVAMFPSEKVQQKQTDRECVAGVATVATHGAPSESRDPLLSLATESVGSVASSVANRVANVMMQKTHSLQGEAGSVASVAGVAQLSETTGSVAFQSKHRRNQKETSSERDVETFATVATPATEHPRLPASPSATSLSLHPERERGVATELATVATELATAFADEVWEIESSIDDGRWGRG